MSTDSHIKPTSKYKESKLASKESNTLDNKHRTIVKTLNIEKNNKEGIENELKNIDFEIEMIDKRRDNFTLEDIKYKANLLDKKDNLEIKYKTLLKYFVYTTHEEHS